MQKQVIDLQDPRLLGKLDDFFNRFLLGIDHVLGNLKPELLLLVRVLWFSRIILSQTQMIIPQSQLHCLGIQSHHGVDDDPSLLDSLRLEGPQREVHIEVDLLTFRNLFLLFPQVVQQFFMFLVLVEFREEQDHQIMDGLVFALEIPNAVLLDKVDGIWLFAFWNVHESTNQLAGLVFLSLQELEELLYFES